MYGGVSYAGGAFAGGGSSVADIPAGTEPILAVEIAFTTGALEEPVWENVSDVRSWNVSRGRNRELERFQPGRATVVLGNLDRQYDSANTAGPHAGNLRPMRRIRIRETLSGVTYPVFDGHIDKIQLDYPGGGYDATATVTATDGFKLLARADVPRSVYTRVHSATTQPLVWWRLDETKTGAEDAALVALNDPSARNLATVGEYVGPPELGAQGLVVKDPGSGMRVVDSDAAPGTTGMGIIVSDSVFDLFLETSWMFEAWCLPEIHTSSGEVLMFNNDSTGTAQLTYQSSGVDVIFQFRVVNSVGTNFSVTTGPGVLPPHRRYHVVARFAVGEPLALWVNGAKSTGGTPAGTFPAGNPTTIGHFPADPGFNWNGTIDEVAFYGTLSGDLLTDAEIAAHYAAGTTPWAGDLPAQRAGRILDIVGWPATLRELDAGTTTLQSAALATSALEHLHKIGETEAGNLFMNRAGHVRLAGQAGIAARVSQGVFGDAAGEVGYRSVRFDDGDTLIRNRATISRLDGVARVAEDAASIEEFGGFDYTLEGLLHDTDAYSETYAQTVVARYKDPRRRIVGLDLGPAAPGDAAVLYPQMLGRELGDVITVRHRPPGGGAVFAQDSTIEGVEHSGAPGGRRTTRWVLSPAATTPQTIWDTYESSTWDDLASSTWEDL